MSATSQTTRSAVQKLLSCAPVAIGPLVVVLIILAPLPATMRFVRPLILDLAMAAIVPWFWWHCAAPALRHWSADRVATGLVLGVSVLTTVGAGVSLVAGMTSISNAGADLVALSGPAWIIVVGIGWPRYTLLRGFTRRLRPLLTPAERLHADLCAATEAVNHALARWRRLADDPDVEHRRAGWSAFRGACEVGIRRLDAAATPTPEWRQARDLTRGYFEAFLFATEAGFIPDADEAARRNAEVERLGRASMDAWGTAKFGARPGSTADVSGSQSGPGEATRG